MKVGDVVKYRFRARPEESAEGVGLVTDTSNTTAVFENRHATVMWGGHRPGGSRLHRFALLEVISESR